MVTIEQPILIISFFVLISSIIYNVYMITKFVIAFFRVEDFILTNEQKINWLLTISYIITYLKFA